MKEIKDLQFFKKDTVELAKDLIGKWVVTNIGGVERKAQISETEAYLGVSDSACHTYKGKRTSRNEPMWQDGGTIYIYLCYGMHYLFNIVSKTAGEPEAVLVRAVVEANGPAKLTRYLNIDKSLNEKCIVGNLEIKIFDDGKKYKYTTQTRVGIDYALEEDRLARLRFVLS